MGTPEKGEAFWLVWCDAQNACDLLRNYPFKQHASRANAGAEAERLCRAHPGHAFYVVVAVRKYKRVEVEMTDLAEPLPF